MNANILTDANIEEYLPLIPPDLPNMELRALHFIRACPEESVKCR